jgi:hypothetical protein
MEQELDTCSGVVFDTAIVLATGLIGDPRDALLPPIVHWKSYYVQLRWNEISDAFLRCYLRQDWR